MRFRLSWKKKEKIRRSVAGILSGIIFLSNTVWTLPNQASDIWPQKATTPFYCIDGGKGWQNADRYGNYKFDTLPSPLSETQAKRLFWAYPKIWNDYLKDAAKKYDPELYQQIASIRSDANIVKRVKDDSTTKFSWIADNPEIEARAMDAILKDVLESSSPGKEAPEIIREATSEENAVPFTVLPFSDGPAALDTEIELGSDFIRDIAKIEPQSVWDNGSSGGNVGWLDASQDKNIAKSVLGENLYEVTWSGDSIKIHNNGSALANENAVGSDLPDEVKYNKTIVRFKITLREGSDWYTETEWNSNYLHEWMDFKACVNAPDHQRLYYADIRVKASAPTFYLVLDQGSSDTPAPDYGTPDPSVDFHVYRHQETFESDYNVRLKKMDAETGKPLKGSQFYLYERFDSAGELSESQEDAGLTEENLSISPWDGFQIFTEGTTDDHGVISYKDSRSYEYEKTYCNGHGLPNWAEIPEEEADETTGEIKNESAIAETKDKNRASAQVWLDLVSSCEAESKDSDTHFHWLSDEALVDLVERVLSNGEPAGSGGGASKEEAFSGSGCEADCEETYEKFINLKFTYTWKEIQARTGYILNGIHGNDLPIEMITTNSSQAGADASFAGGYSKEIEENIWYAGGGGGRAVKAIKKAAAAKTLYDGEAVKASGVPDVKRQEAPKVKESVASFIKDFFQLELELLASDSNAATASNAANPFNTASSFNAAKPFNTASPSNTTSPSNAKYIDSALSAQKVKAGADDSDWGDAGSNLDFHSYLNSAESDGIAHLEPGGSDQFSHCNGKDPCGDSWQVFDHRTEGRLHINKRDLDLYQKETEEYSSYGDTEGDATLEGAVYGLFAAEDILHPDSIVAADGAVKNTGAVYKRNDLVSLAATDENGNADFLVFTIQPGRVYSYENGKIEKRKDTDWNGPENLYQNAGFKAEINDYTGDIRDRGKTSEIGKVRTYQNNEVINGNCWIGRPLILGNYYIKELSRSEGYELSVNGITQEHTNLGTGFETPEAIAFSHGTAVLSLPELTAAMEGEDGSGNGYNQLSFYVTSSGTVDSSLGTEGYDLVVSGFPEGTSFFRVDTGEEEVTGPHVTGTEDVIIKDENGNTIWKRAESDSSNVKYRPIYGERGGIVSQEPMSREESQILKADQIPEMKAMEISRTDFDLTDPFYRESITDYDLSKEQDPAYLFVKAKVEETLLLNGYDIPVMADGSCSTLTQPVYSRGVQKGDVDVYGQTTDAGSPATKTVYGAAIAELRIINLTDSTTVLELIQTVLAWYSDHPEWSLGGIDKIEKISDGYKVTLYAAASSRGNRRFFTTREGGGKLTADKVYAVHENTRDLRWVYQEYSESGDYTFEVQKQYYLGSGDLKRYYIDVVLKPAMLVNAEGNLQEILHTVMVYHKKGEEIIDYLDGDPANGYRVPLTETRNKIEITTELEQVESDVPLNAIYDGKTGTYTIPVKASGTDRYGKYFTDETGSLKLTFLAVTKQRKVTLTADDIASLGAANVFQYRAGDEIGYVQYLMLFGGASVGVSGAAGSKADDTYIVTKRLLYRGQNKISEDGGSGKTPVQVLERPIKQKVKVVKNIQTEPDGTYPHNSYEIHGDLFQDNVQAIPNFRFKIYLKSNLERLRRNEAGEIFWQDKSKNPVEISKYRDTYPELVQKIYTEESGGVRLLESMTAAEEEDVIHGTEQYNYEKFFHAIQVAHTDQWHVGTGILNSSFKPFAKSNLTGIANEINTSVEAKENAKRSDAVRQFAIDWYLEDEAKKLLRADEDDDLQAAGAVVYSDELYDKALFSAILNAENYLEPFFQYDIDEIYAIAWDSEADGGFDRDKTTLAANMLYNEEGEAKYSYGISEYLPYGDYVLVEQQPWNPAWEDFANKHYAIDRPKEITLPAVYEGGLEEAEEIPEKGHEFYRYRAYDTPDALARKYLIRFNEEMAENHTDDARSYVIRAQSHDGNFEIYQYGLDVDQTDGHYEPYGNQKVAKYYHYDAASENAGMEEYRKDGTKTMSGVRTAYDGEYASMLVPWSMTDPECDSKGKMEDKPKEEAEGKPKGKPKDEPKGKPEDEPKGKPENEPEGGRKDSEQEIPYLGYAYRKMRNTFYAAKLRVEKLDEETGEQILHDDAVFALYAAKRDDSADGDGVVERYESPVVISGSLEFLEAMGATCISPFARDWDSKNGPGKSYYGTIPEGTPICSEKERILLTDSAGVQTGTFGAYSTARDGSMKREDGPGKEDALQTVGYLETPQPVGAGVYVLAEIKPPSGYKRSKPVPVEVYSDEVSYYLDGGTNKTVASVFDISKNLNPEEQSVEKTNGDKEEGSGETARIFVNNTATRLEVSKLKTADTFRKMKVSGRVEGTITELSGRYGLENLDLAYNSSGKYLNYGWLKGTLEFLENRKAAGESVEIIYNESHVFSGYGYVRRKLQTAEDQNRYVPGATLALYDAIEVRLSGDTQDYFLEGVTVERDRNGNVCSVVVEKGYAGEQLELTRGEDEIWEIERILREDTPVLFYDLGGLSVTRIDRDGRLLGYDRDGRAQEITSDTSSIFALRGGVPVLEITGSRFDELVYDEGVRAFTSQPLELDIYHLNGELCRDAMVDGYTGLAYVEKGERRFVWPVNITKNSSGNVIAREKILTGRPAEINADGANAYITGTLAGERLEKELAPVYDPHGLVQYYLRSSRKYQKGEAIYDRDGDYVRYRYDDLLKYYNRAAYERKEHETLFDVGNPEDKNDDVPLWNRLGEAWLIPNVWVSGGKTPNDPSALEMTFGQADMLKRVYPGTYIMEELVSPKGYVHGFPVAVKMEETGEIQKVSMDNEKTKVEILKVDAAESRRPTSADGEGFYTYELVEGAELALFKAKRVYTTDNVNFPKGYYFVKKEQTPAAWMTEDHVDNRPVEVTARWTTGKIPQYFEGIPCGDYILEELSAPPGYVKSSMEVEVEETAELQSFILKNDHTKLEIYK